MERRLRRVASHVTTRAASGSAQGGKILSGVNVLDLSTVIAGPACAAMMADFGASVTKIEPPGGDSWRSGGAMFEQDNRGKRSVCLDLTSEEGYQVFLKMLEGADVVTFYALPELIERLQAKLVGELAPGALAVSHRFPVTDWRPLFVTAPKGDPDAHPLFVYDVHEAELQKQAGLRRAACPPPPSS